MNIFEVFVLLLRSVDWYFVTDVSGQPIGPILNGQAVLILEDGTDRFPETSATNYHSTLPKIPEDQIPHLHRGGSLKSKVKIFFSPMLPQYLKRHCFA